MDISPPDPLDGVVALSGQDDDGACRGLQNGLLHGPGAVQLNGDPGKRLAMSPGSSKSGLSVVKKMRSAYLPHISPMPWIRWGERPPAMPVTTVMGAPG